jgi:hypothetical protein
MDKYFRLSSLIDFLKIPEVTPFQEKIYHSPVRYHHFKITPTQTPPTSIKKKSCSKREQHFKKVLQKVYREDLDRFLRQKYSTLFREIEKILPV